MLHDGLVEDGEPHRFDVALGALFLRADIGRLAAFASLPDVLERLGLYLAKSALLHALGYPHEIPEEVVQAEGGSLDAFFASWRDLRGAASLGSPAAGEGATAVIASTVLGCRVTVPHETREPAISVAESILAAFESLASTFLGAGVIAHEPVLSVSIRVTEFADAPWSFRCVEERGRPTFYVACRAFSPHILSPDEQVAVKTPLRDLVIAMFSRVAFLRDDEILEPLIGEDRALQRAIDFTSSFLVVGSELGLAPKTTVAEWVADGEESYPAVRTEAWDAALVAEAPQAHVDVPGTAADDRTCSPATPSPLPRPSRHSEVRTVSLIRIPLWERAKWRGVFFYSPPDEPPLMCLVFQQPDAARDILLGLQEDLGGVDDVSDALRITILRGIDAENPAYYRMVIGQSLPDATDAQAPALWLQMSRIHEMQPETSENLDRFLAAYNAAGSYGFSVATLNRHGEPLVVPTVIRKRQLTVRDAWTIGPGDLDAVGLREDDNVIVPKDVVEPPVRELQAWLAALGPSKP